MHPESLDAGRANHVYLAVERGWRQRHLSATFGRSNAARQPLNRGPLGYDAGLVERVADALVRIGERGARQKNVFGGRGFLKAKSTFVIVWDDGLIVKTPAAEYAVALAMPGVEPFAPDGERPMGTWVVVSADAIADDPELTDWIRRGLHGIGR